MEYTNSFSLFDACNDIEWKSLKVDMRDEALLALILFFRLEFQDMLVFT